MAQSQAIERVQKTCIRVILEENYKTYTDGLELTGLELLNERREKRCIQFGLKCLVHPIQKRMFPANPKLDEGHSIRSQEHFVVNKARTDSYNMSDIPYIQRKLNLYVKAQQRMKN